MKLPSTTLIRSLLGLLAVSGAAAAHAQTAINQSTATSGTDYGYLQDAPGFPVSIFIPGSYKLTSNLVVPPGGSGIEILVKGVTLDLNGFEIRTAATCSRDEVKMTVSCPPTIGETGVEFKQGSGVLRNGRISGFYRGVIFKGADHLQDLVVENNLTGVYSLAFNGARTLIRNVRAQFNKESGFFVQDALIEGSTAALNGSSGFWAGNTMIVDSFSYKNHTHGFQTWQGPLAVGRTTAWANGGPDYVGDYKSMGDNMPSSYVRF